MFACWSKVLLAPKSYDPPFDLHGSTKVTFGSISRFHQKCMKIGILIDLCMLIKNLAKAKVVRPTVWPTRVTSFKKIVISAPARIVTRLTSFVDFVTVISVVQKKTDKLVEPGQIGIPICQFYRILPMRNVRPVRFLWNLVYWLIVEQVWWTSLAGTKIVGPTVYPTRVNKGHDWVNF